MQLVQRVARRDRAQRVDQLGFHQVLDRLRVVHAVAQRLRGKADAVIGAIDAHVELGADVYAHAVGGDEGILAAAVHHQLDRVELHLGQRVHHRQDHRAAVLDHLAAAHAGAHEGLVALGALVEPAEDEADDGQHEQDDAGPDEKLNDVLIHDPPQGSEKRLPLFECSSKVEGRPRHGRLRVARGLSPEALPRRDPPGTA